MKCALSRLLSRLPCCCTQGGSTHGLPSVGAWPATPPPGGPGHSRARPSRRARRTGRRILAGAPHDGASCGLPAAAPCSPPLRSRDDSACVARACAYACVCRAGRGARAGKRPPAIGAAQQSDEWEGGARERERDWHGLTLLFRCSLPCSPFHTKPQKNADHDRLHPGPGLGHPHPGQPVSGGTRRRERVTATEKKNRLGPDSLALSRRAPRVAGLLNWARPGRARAAQPPTPTRPGVDAGGHLPTAFSRGAFGRSPPARAPA